MIYLRDDFDPPADGYPEDVLEGLCAGYRRRCRPRMSNDNPSVERRLYEAVIAFCEERGIELNRGPMADLCLPAGVNVQYRVPIAALESAE
jgi:hypothetical protein